LGIGNWLIGVQELGKMVDPLNAELGMLTDEGASVGNWKLGDSEFG
jgi:hypothetical protein